MLHSLAHSIAPSYADYDNQRGKHRGQWQLNNDCTVEIYNSPSWSDTAFILEFSDSRVVLSAESESSRDVWIDAISSQIGALSTEKRYEMWTAAAAKFDGAPFSNGRDARYEQVKAELRDTYGRGAVNDSNKNRLKTLAMSRSVEVLST